MKHFGSALKQLLSDLLSTIVFVAIFWLTGNIYLTTGLAIGAAVLQVAWMKLRGRNIDAMVWLSLGLVIVFGGTTLLLHDPRFVMTKPSIIHAAIGMIMLRRGWLGRYLPPIARDNLSEAELIGVGYAWALIFFGLAAANLVLAWTVDIALWAWLVSFGGIAVKLAAFGATYAFFRITVRGRIRRQRTAPIPYPVGSPATRA